MELKKLRFYQMNLSDKLDNGVIISFSFSTLDEKLAKIIEPGAPSPIARLETMKKYNAAGFKTGILICPYSLSYLIQNKILNPWLKLQRTMGHIMFYIPV